MDHKKLKLKIFGQEYAMLVENEEIATDLARYVDKKMQETKEALPDQNIQTIAVISSLNIAHELFLEKSKFNEFSNAALAKMKEIQLLSTEIQVSAPSS
ncbi:MAG: cell division protein ZapA [Ignavibacteria bacterium]